jgi:hypothetical protein
MTGRNGSRSAGLVVLLVLTAALSGCDVKPSPSGTPSSKPTRGGAFLNTPVPSPTLDAGWSSHADAAQGYAIAFPDTWSFVFRDSPTFDADIKTISTSAADLGKYFSDAFSKGQAGGVRLIAAEPRSLQSGFVTNMSVLKTDLGDPASAPDVDAVAASKRALISKNQTLQGDVKEERTQLPAGTAELISYSIKPADADVAVSTYLMTADFPGRRVLYEVIIGTNVKDSASLFDRIARSFRLLPAAPGPSPSK